MAEEQLGLNAELSLDARDFIRQLDTVISRAAELGNALGLTDREVKNLDRTLNSARRAVTGVASDQAKAAEAAKKHEQELRRQESQLIRTRYALYDVATTYGIISAAALASAGVVASTAIQYESAFTAVERTTLDSSGKIAGNIGQIRQELLDLSTTIPVAFDEITRIASLGAQLRIATNDLEQFTETVAKFAATTNISVDEAALAFGQLGNLLGVPAEQFENLGSSIALVGVNSAATESQIVSIAREIAPAARASGFAADEVIGLSGALGSIRVPPERSRSTILQFFETLNMAVADGGTDLENFARVVGVTTEQLDAMVRGGEGQDILRRFIGTTATADTIEITQALEALGLAGLRTNPTIRALSDNIQLLDQTYRDAAQGFEEGTFLDQAFATVLDDVASQLKILANSLGELLATAGRPFIDFLSATLPLVTGVVKALSDFAATPVGQTISAITAALTVALGLYTAYRAAIALATASTYALITANAGLAAQGAATGIRGLMSAMLGLTSATRAATGATTGLSLAIRAIPVAGTILAVVGALTAVATGANTAADRALDLANRLREVRAEGDLLGSAGATQTFEKLTQEVESYTDAILAGIRASDQLDARGDNLYGGGAFQRLNNSAQLGTARLTELNGALVSLVQSGESTLASQVFKSIQAELLAGGLTAVEVSKMFAGYRQALREINAATSEGATGFAGWIEGLNLGAESLDLVSDSATTAAERIYTLVDYANDLSSVFSRSFDIRFGAGLALDEVSDSFAQLTDRINQARISLQGLTADRNIKQYFLGIAEAYGDELRAGQLRAELAEINEKIADTQADASTELNDNTKAGRNNRKAITQLLTQYEQYITALAASGADQDTLNNAVEQSRDAFYAQATALGFSGVELAQYVSHFNDLSLAVARVPRNITVTANADPALQAINEFLDAARASIGGGIDIPVNTSFDPRAAKAIAIQGLLDAAVKQLASVAPGNYGAISSLELKIQQLRNELLALGFASGGYTGAGGKYQPAGIVHRGEYVVPKEQVNQRTGLPYADALGRPQRGTSGYGYASGGPVRGGGAFPMDLSVTSIRGIANALSGRPIVLQLADGRQLAAVVNGTNEMQSLRGKG